MLSICSAILSLGTFAHGNCTAGWGPPVSFTTYIVTTIENLHEVIKGLPDDMQVQIAEGVYVTAATVRDLRALGSFPGRHERLRIVTPRQRYPEDVVKIELPD